MATVTVDIVGNDKLSGPVGSATDSVSELDKALIKLAQQEASKKALDEAREKFETLTDAEKEALLATEQLAAAQDTLAGENESVSLSLTDLKSGLDMAMQAIQTAGKISDETVGKFQAYAATVRDMAAISGQSAEDTSRFIQVLDDWGVSAEQATAATRVLTKQGLTPNIETIATLSDQYLAITDAQERNEFVIKNLGRAGLEWNQVLSQGSAALREQAAAVSGSLVLTQEMLDRAEKLRLAQDQLNDTWEATKIAIGEKAVPAITAALTDFNGRAEQSSLLQAVLTTGFDDIFKVIGDVVRGTDEAVTATDNLTGAQTNSIPTAEEVAEAQRLAAEAAQALSDSLSSQISLISSIQSYEDSYAQKSADLSAQRLQAEQDLADAKARGYEKSIGEYDGLQLKVDELKTKEAELTAEYEKQTLTFVSGILQQNLARDGWTQAEFDAFTKQQEAWGLWSADTVAKAQAAWQEADKITASINAIPTNKTVTIDMKTAIVGNDVQATTQGGYAYNYLNGDTPGYASGTPFASGGSAWVGERGPELVNLPRGSQVVPAGQSGGASIDWNMVGSIVGQAVAAQMDIRGIGV